MRRISRRRKQTCRRCSGPGFASFRLRFCSSCSLSAATSSANYSATSWPDSTIIIPVTAYHQRSCVVAYSRSNINLLSAPLTIPLICCHIKIFGRASGCGEVRARRRKEERRSGSASQGISSAWVVSPPVCGHRGIPARGVVPDPCHSAGSAVDVCSDASA